MDIKLVDRYHIDINRDTKFKPLREAWDRLTFDKAIQVKYENEKELNSMLTQLYEYNRYVTPTVKSKADKPHKTVYFFFKH
jgi:hypothetical protein